MQLTLNGLSKYYSSVSANYNYQQLIKHTVDKKARSSSCSYSTVAFDATTACIGMMIAQKRWRGSTEEGGDLGAIFSDFDGQAERASSLLVLLLRRPIIGVNVPLQRGLEI